MSCRLIVREEGRERVLELKTETILVGRGADCQIALTDSKCSRRHCEVVPFEGGYKLVDLESRNGTRVNDSLVNQRMLAHGDLIKIGEASIYFEDPLRDPERKIPGRLKDYREAGGIPTAAPVAAPPPPAAVQPGPVDLSPPKPSLSRTTERFRRDAQHRPTEGLPLSPAPTSRHATEERRREQEEQRIVKNVAIVVGVFLSVIALIIAAQSLARKSPAKRIAEDYLESAREKYRQALSHEDPRAAVALAREALKDISEIPSDSGDPFVHGKLLAEEIRDILAQKEALVRGPEALELEALAVRAAKAKSARDVEAAMGELAAYRARYPEALPETIKRLDQIDADLKARRGTTHQRDFEEAQERVQESIKRNEFSVALGEAEKMLETFKGDFTLQQKAVEQRERVMEAVRVYVEQRRARAQEYRGRGDREMALRVYDEILGALGQGRVQAFRGYVELIMQERGE